MTVTELIKALEAARKSHGDLPVYTFAGLIRQARLEPSYNGLAMVSAPGKKPNELTLEVM